MGSSHSPTRQHQRHLARQVKAQLMLVRLACERFIWLAVPCWWCRNHRPAALLTGESLASLQLPAATAVVLELLK